MRLNKAFSFIIALIALIFLIKSLPIHRQSCSRFQNPVFSKRLNFLKGEGPLDTGVVLLNDKPYFVLAYMTPPGRRGKSNPLFIYPMSESGEILSNVFMFGETEHIRSINKIKTPWGDGLLMADHGVDGDGYKGGKLLLIVAQADGTLIDKSDVLPRDRNFAFNAISVRRSNSLYDDILITPFNSAHSKVIYLKANSLGYADASFLLPKEWVEKKVCFMTAIPFDVERDGHDEIVLGSCDLNRDQSPLENDKMLVWKNSHWEFAKENVLPPRKQNATWGTVYWLKNDRELISLVHNKGFTKADVQYFSYDEKLKKFTENAVLLNSKEREKFSYYFHKIQKFKDTFYGLIRFQKNGFVKPNVFSLVLNKEGGLKEQPVCLALPENETVLGLDSFIDSRGAPVLLLTYYSGRYDLFR